MILRLGSVLGLVVAVLSIVALLYQNSLFGVGAVAIAVRVLAVLLMLWARLTFGPRSFHAAANPTEGGLVTSGPYRFLRHPIYAAVLYFVWAGVFSHLSLGALLFGALATLGFAVRMMAEERLVAQRYPEYVAYAARTRRVIPFVI